MRALRRECAGKHLLCASDVSADCPTREHVAGPKRTAAIGASAFIKANRHSAYALNPRSIDWCRNTLSPCRADMDFQRWNSCWLRRAYAWDWTQRLAVPCRCVGISQSWSTEIAATINYVFVIRSVAHCEFHCRAMSEKRITVELTWRLESKRPSWDHSS